MLFKQLSIQRHISIIGIFICCCVSCKKYVQIAPPTNTITTSQVFADSANALSALGGLYADMINTGSVAFGDGFITVYCGASADELLPFESSGDQVSTNTLIASSGVFFNGVWIPAYNYIYRTNAILEGLESSRGISSAVKDQIRGETKFFRAFFNFYLVNLFGDVPLITNTNYKTNTLAPQAPMASIYQSIEDDLKDAQSVLPEDYSAGNGERIRINKWAATALLARVYLYTNKYDSAEAQASSIINATGLFSLTDSVNDAFLKNSTEAILQWQINSNLSGANYNATAEEVYFARAPFYPPTHYLTDQLLAAFEPGDMRKIKWLDSTVYNSGSSTSTYYYPYKYKIGTFQRSPGAEPTEYYMVLRLAEQYLIRAEARAQENDLSGAISDIDAIRNRAGLPNTTAVSQTDILGAVAQERRIELFAEWGHRWLDLKRTGQAHNVLSVIPYKSQWQDYQQLYPIPPTEMISDPNLKQNPGYY